MDQYQYQSSLHPNEQDRARMDLLKCSENLEQSNRFLWDESRQSNKKQKQKRYYTEMLQLQKKEEENSQERRGNQGTFLGKLMGDLPLKQRSAKAAKRSSTNYRNGRKIHHSCQGEPASHTVLSPAKNNLVDSAFPDNPQPNLTKTRSKTVFIHMLKNKSANFRPQSLGSEKIIHNLSAIKVRIMARKIQQSKSMNFTHQQLKLKLETTTKTQEIKHRKQKSYFRHNKISLYQLISKRHKFREIASQYHQNP